LNYNQNETIGFIGEWTIESENVKTGLIKSYNVKNAITQGFFTKVHRFLSQDQLTVANSELNITHLEMGLGTTPATRNDSAMEDGIEREPTTVKTFTDTVYTAKWFLDTAVGNLTGGYIKELGIFAEGTATLGSGTMISHTIVNIQKDENIRLTLSWKLRGN